MLCISLDYIMEPKQRHMCRCLLCLSKPTFSSQETLLHFVAVLAALKY